MKNLKVVRDGNGFWRVASPNEDGGLQFWSIGYRLRSEAKQEQTRLEK